MSDDLRGGWTDGPHRWTAPATEAPLEDPKPSAGSRVASIVLALVAGAVYGAVGTVAHPLSFAVGPLVVPWGLGIALVGVLALFVGFRLVLGERLAVVAAGVGVVGIVSLFSLQSVGGSILIQQSVPGLVWVVAPAVLAALVASLPAPRSASGASGDPSASPVGRLDGPDAKEIPAP